MSGSLLVFLGFGSWIVVLLVLSAVVDFILRRMK
jgi:hypothetical protein